MDPDLRRGDVGIMSDLGHRMAEHTQCLIDGFTTRYDVKHLVYYEFHVSMADAIKREKRLKDWRRASKVPGH